MRKSIKIFLLFAGILFPVFVFGADGTIDSTNKYAWSDNMGWINFNPTNGNVVVSDTEITGYAWNDNYGWINLSPTNSGISNSSGTLSGYAWGEGVGWINFSGVTINCDGEFSGTATGDVAGNISFDCTNCSVTTDWRAASCGGTVCGNASCESGESCSTCPADCGTCPAVCGNDSCESGETCASCQADCGLCPWNPVFHRECNTDLQCISVIGPGANQCETNTNCTSHRECNTQRQCVSVETPGPDLCYTESDCSNSHNECSGAQIVCYPDICFGEQCVSVLGFGTNQCQVDSDCESIRHNVCNEQKQCVSVDGEGQNMCQTNNDCQTHNECNLSFQCIQVTGVGSNLCQTDQDCRTATHSECNVEKKCVQVNGEDVDQCDSDEDCQEEIEQHSECNSEKKCVLVEGAGPDFCVIDGDCQRTHLECNAQKQCVSVTGVGIDQCVQDSDCSRGRHNICNVERQCVPTDGEGDDECQTNRDCSSGTTGALHSECKNWKCIYVEGGGENECNSDNECKPDIIEIITEPFEEIPEFIGTVIEETKKIIETPAGYYATKALSTFGLVAVGASMAFSFSFFEIFLVPLRLISLLLTAFGIKKRSVPWGTVYDSITKQPLDPAYVTLIDQNGKKIASAITDLDGRYGFLTETGTYRIEANKTHYIFPSKKLAGRTQDELYANLYFGELFDVRSRNEAVIRNIPLDPINFDWNEFAKRDKKLMKYYSKWDSALREVSDIFFVIGFIVALVAFFFAPYPYNTIIIILYFIFLLLRIFGIKPRPFGIVSEQASGGPLSYGIIRIFMAGTDRQIAWRVLDKFGRYYCLVSPGGYNVRIERKNSDGSYSEVYRSSLISVGKDGIIKKKFQI